MDIHTLQSFFGWCTILNSALLIVKGIICAVAGDLIYPIHKAIFSISRDEFNVTVYRYFGSFNTAVVVLCLVPWIALEIVA